jgi:hypothetical protein
MKLTQFTLLSLALVLSGTAFGQSNLPACPALDNSQTGIKRTQSWNNCVGRYAHGDGFVYQGEYKNGVPNGYGTSTFATGEKYVGEWKDGKRHGQGTATFANGDKYVGEYKDDKFNGQGTYFRADGRIGLGEWVEDKPSGRFIEYRADKTVERSGIFKNSTLVTSQFIDPNSFTRIASNNTSPAITDSQRQEIEQRERQIAIDSERLAEERRRLELEKQQREQERISSRIAITATATQPDANGEFLLSIQTSADTASLQIDGEEQGGKKDGKYSIRRVARVGEQNVYTISARDIYGNTDTKTIAVARQVADSRPVPLRLNPLNIKVQQPRDAVAIIIGIEKYKRVGKADFANLDAKDFYNYASRALGIKPENIKLLLDDGADDVEIYKAFQSWLPLKVKKGKTDVYVFYSGHGLPSQDGKELYFLPYGVDKDLISKTAINNQEIVSAIQTAQPKSVTMFIDSCYSGKSRVGETLVAGMKPISLKVSDSVYPADFTVITASAFDQISSASQDLKHGIFSFFLMKGMEGDADENKDGRITAGEMQNYLSEMVSRQALSMDRRQQTQLFGNPERVLMTVGK